MTMDPPPPGLVPALRKTSVRLFSGLLPCPCSVHILEYDAHSFTAAAFDTERIVCPPSVARSVPHRQAEFFFGRLAARAALSTLGRSTAQVEVGAFREPVWPKGIVGSISHSGNVAIATALRDDSLAAIGLDVELIVTNATRNDVLAVVVDDVEVAYLRTMESRLSFDTMLTLVFSAKESLFKGASRRRADRYGRI